MNTNKWQPEHFPVGTCVTVCVTVNVSDTNDSEYDATVTGVSCNGVDSYLIHYKDISGPGAEAVNKRHEVCSGESKTDLNFVNISHVTKIHQRGEGEVVWIKEEQDSKRIDWIFNNVGLPKHHSQYTTADLLLTVDTLSTKYISNNMIVDYSKLISMLSNGNYGLKKIKFRPSSDWLYFSINKKKLNKAIKRLINKCLVKKSVKLKKEYEYWDEIDNRVFDEHLTSCYDAEDMPLYFNTYIGTTSLGDLLRQKLNSM